MIQHKTILITGGTGSFGKAFTLALLTLANPPKSILVYSRDELKQWQMAQDFQHLKYFNRLHFIIGDVRDSDRLRRSCDGVDILIHAAALKQIPTAEYNPTECIHTNITGAENVINAALDCKVEKVITLSTDKAVSPISLYGASKLCSDKLFIAANNSVKKNHTKCSVVRYGNVMGTSGSVIPLFLENRQSGSLPVTHKDMTRFNITLEEASAFVLYAIEHMKGGEIFVPKAPSYKVLDLAQAIAPSCKIRFMGIRDGEKIHEELISKMESFYTYEYPNHFAVLQNDKNRSITRGRKVSENFSYSSKENTRWLSVETLRSLIKTHIDASFMPS